jgi:hypothetical protein
MLYLKRVTTKLGIMGELLQFFWERKLWWMIPLVVVILLLGLVIVFTQGTAVAPFVYTLF